MEFKDLVGQSRLTRGMTGLKSLPGARVGGPQGPPKAPVAYFPWAVGPLGHGSARSSRAVMKRVIGSVPLLPDYFLELH